MGTQNFSVNLYLVNSRENEGTEREAPSPALGICHVHETYF